MNLYALIVAGGSGSRMKSDVPKQFMLLQNKPVLMHTIKCFYNYLPLLKIIVVLPENQFKVWNDLCKQHHFDIEHQLAKGADVRFGSVNNGLNFVTEPGLVAIHDGVRPLVSNETIHRCFELAKQKGNAIAGMPAIESLRVLDEDGDSKAVDREKFISVQTPQVFDIGLIKKAYQQQYSTYFTDDASVVEQLGTKIYIAEGNDENIKITRPVDLIMAESIIKNFSI